MATRQYIGARYVIKIYENSQTAGSAEWESGTSYEPLTMVTYQNSSYLSKKAVPASVGNPASNTDYWVVTGMYNGQITSLQNQIDAINTDIQSINTLISNIRSIDNRHIVIVGDSYADDDPTDYAYLIKNSGVFRAVDVVAGGGWGFTGKDTGSGATTSLKWLTNFTTFVNGLTDAEKADIDDVYIIGGFNDHYSSVATIQNYMIEFFSYAHTALPVNYHLIECGWAYDTGDITTPQGTFTAENVRIAIGSKVISEYAKASNYGCTWHGSVVSAIHDYANDYDSTHYHPSAIGSNKLAIAILNIMLGCDYMDTGNAIHYIKNGSDDFAVYNTRMNGNTLYCMGYTNRLTATIADTSVGAYGNATLNGITASTTKRLIGSRGTILQTVMPCIVQYPDGNMYQTYCFPDNTGALHITTPVATTSSDSLRIRFLNTTFSMLDC